MDESQKTTTTNGYDDDGPELVQGAEPTLQIQNEEFLTENNNNKKIEDDRGGQENDESSAYANGKKTPELVRGREPPCDNNDTIASNNNVTTSNNQDDMTDVSHEKGGEHLVPEVVEGMEPSNPTFNASPEVIVHDIESVNNDAANSSISSETSSTTESVGAGDDSNLSNNDAAIIISDSENNNINEPSTMDRSTIDSDLLALHHQRGRADRSTTDAAHPTYSESHRNTGEEALPVALQVEEPEQIVIVPITILSHSSNDETENMSSYSQMNDNDDVGKEVSKPAARRRRLWIIVFIASTLLILIIAVVSGIVVRTGNKPPAQQSEDNALRQQQPNNHYVDETAFLTSVFSSVSILDNIQNPVTPQGRALAWIQEEFNDKWSHLIVDIDAQLSDDNANAIVQKNNANEHIDRLIERYILVVLYYTTNGDEWLYKHDFLKHETDICDWYHRLGRRPSYVPYSPEIICNDEKRLTDIILLYLNVQGPFPLELWYLSRLTRLDFTVNKLIGTIPSFPAELKSSNLQVLSLRNNTLTGKIPSFHGASLLSELHLWGNALTGTIPTNLGRLSNLQILSLSSNVLYGSIPSFVGALTNLKELFLMQNSLTGSIPKEVKNAQNLTRLWLYENQLNSTIPSFLGSMSQLTDLILFRNQFTGTIPEEIGQLSELTVLSMGNNNLQGRIPISLGNLSQAKFEALALNDMSLTGTIPSHLGQLGALKMLFLQNNRLTGSIPSELGELSNLINLELYGNSLEGDAQFLCGGSYRQRPFFVVDANKVQCPCCTRW